MKTRMLSLCRASNPVGVSLLIQTLALCHCGRGPDVDRAVDTPSELYARSTALWPLRAQRAKVRVCWLPLELGGRDFPVPDLAPDLTRTLAERKRWARRIVQKQWNSLTPLRFVGWRDCAANHPADVRLQPISSVFQPPCGGKGQSCADALGTQLRDQSRAVYLNLLFGDEALYSSRYQQSHPGQSYDAADDVEYWWLPQACLSEFRYAWSTNNTLTSHPVDIEEQSHLATFMQIYKECLQFNVLHEFGHVAGFAHEQYRPDDQAERQACRAYVEAFGIADDFRNVAPMYLGDRPLGPFDSESIMSYCRRNPRPVLSDEDITMASAVYRSR